MGDALSLPAANAINAYLLSGGRPGILRAWPDGLPPLEFAERECADPASPLFGVPEAARLVEDKHVLALDEPLSVEPTIREALSIAAADLPWPEATAVGGWWNRAFDPEIDLVGADRGPVARKLRDVGSVKWLDQPFGRRDLSALQLGAPQVPGFDSRETALIGVSCTGFTDPAATDLALRWLPSDIVGAFA